MGIFSEHKLIRRMLALFLTLAITMVFVLPIDQYSWADEPQPDPLPEIEGVVITALDSEYNGAVQQLVSASAITFDVTTEYSLDGEEWSTQIPYAVDAGSHTIIVKIEKEGYATYYSEPIEAKISKKSISGIGVLGNTVTYVDGLSQELVTVTGSLEPGDEVRWYVDDVLYEGEGIPRRTAVGNYSVMMVVNRGENYSEYYDVVTGTILNAQLDTTGLSITGLDSVYDGTSKAAVSVQNAGDYELEYQLDDGDMQVDDSAWNTEIPMVTDAGSYIVWVKATKENYYEKPISVIPAENAVAPYNVYVAKAEQSFMFDYYFTESTSTEISYEQMEAGEEFHFCATDVNNKANGTILYSIDFPCGDDGIASIDETTGTLTVSGAGIILVNATLSGNDNYEECTIGHELFVSGKSGCGDWISVADDVIEYTIGSNEGIKRNICVNKGVNDDGVISFSITTGAAMGLSIDDNGNVSVDDYGKLAGVVEECNGELNVQINVHKDEYSRTEWEGTCKYPADETTYVLKVMFATIPEAPYTLYSLDEQNDELTEANGANGWYTTGLSIVPKETYTIIRSDAFVGNNPLFDTSVRFGETVDDIAQDQGEGSSWGIYLRNTETGEITEKILLIGVNIDTVIPTNLEIEFPDKEAIDSVKYYGESITVSFYAEDETSGIDYFIWEYMKEEGASASILNEYIDTEKVEAHVDSTDESGHRFVGSLVLPIDQAEQLRGSLKLKAVDKAGNESISYTDTGVFVVDTIAPNQVVEYGVQNGPRSSQSSNGKRYFSGNVDFSFKITEANFYGEDVNISVSKNGAGSAKQEVSWTQTETADQYQASLVLNEDGEYVVTMSYKDRSGNNMTGFTSETIVIDKTKPVIEFIYHNYADKSGPQTASISIIEKNFNQNTITVSVVARDINGNSVDTADLQRYLQTCSWSSEGDRHSTTISNEFTDGIYDLTINCSDLASNPASEVKSGQFIVDRTAPKTAEMSIKYSDPAFETLLSSVKLLYYSPGVTVTLEAHDHVSGIDHFTWGYQKENGASDINIAEYYSSTVAAVQDASDKSKYTAKITLPKDKADQLRGMVSFSATDICNNAGSRLTDTNHVIVVDTVSPQMTVEYSQAVNSQAEKDYYDCNLVATFTVTEANFYGEDVEVKVIKDSTSSIVLTPAWTDLSKDTHVGLVEIEAKADHSNDGDYVFQVNYKDKSNNQMKTYVSGIKVIDTTAPVINVSYGNSSLSNEIVDEENHLRKYYSSTQTATVSIIEHNFDKDEVRYVVTTKDAAGNELDLESLYSVSEWTKDGDINTLIITYPGDANYTFDIECNDLAKILSDDYAEDYFTVDLTKPTDLEISYETSVLDTVLSTVTFGFYNSSTTVTVTARDNISGIHSFKYGFDKADGSAYDNEYLTDSSSIVNSDGGRVGTLTFEVPGKDLPQGSQFNGNVNFSAFDRAGNESDYLRDTKRIVVDNIAPSADVTYNAPVQTTDGVSYYDGDISVKLEVREANFYSDDVRITVVKDGVSSNIAAQWDTIGQDVHSGSFSLVEDGDYLVKISYTDKSTNEMKDYTSERMTIDTELTEASVTINGHEANGQAFKDEVVPRVSFYDRNFESCEVKMYKSELTRNNVDVSNQFVAGNIVFNEYGGEGEFDLFDKLAENDGIYTITTTLTDKAGHKAENSIRFTVNRFGSVYEYNEQLTSLINDGGAYVQGVEQDLVIREYNADRILKDSINLEILRDGRPLEKSEYTVSEQSNHSESLLTENNWYQYTYTISKSNFGEDGMYKVAVSSRDATGNTPENNNYEDKVIVFHVDSTNPEITGIAGLETDVINMTDQTVKYFVYDTQGLNSVLVYVDGEEVENISDFSSDYNNYEGSFVLNESSSAQKVRLVVADKAGNITDTDSDSFESSYEFNREVTVSTNLFVRWFANKPLFYMTIAGGVVALGGGAGAIVFFRRRRLKVVK